VDRVGLRGIHQVLEAQAVQHPNKECFVVLTSAGERESATYSEFVQLVERCAVAFSALGIEPGDAVVLHLGTSLDFLTCWFACFRLGAVAVPTNLASPGFELAHAMRTSGARHVVTEAGLADAFDQAQAFDAPDIKNVIIAREAAGRAGVTTLAALLDAVAVDARLDRPQPNSDAPAEVLFTSGTTSAPKGVLLSNANLILAGERTSLHYRLTPQQRVMTLLPLFHVGGQAMGVMCAIVIGATAVLVEKYSASRFVDQVRQERTDFMMILPVHVRTLLAQPPREVDSEHLLRDVGFGMRITEEERDRFEDRFGMRLLYCYGQTEASLLLAIAPRYGPRNWPAVGLPAMDRQLRVVDDAGRDVATGVIGHIIAAGVPGRTIMIGYIGDPEATARTVVDGWLHTGDLGSFDEDGYLHFADREKDMIKRNGENIAALEVETVLLSHPSIEDCAVIGVPDPIRDEAVKAFIVLKPAEPAMTADDVIAYCTERLAPFKVPTLIEFRDDLPKTPIGKIAKKELRGGG
jgi:crotonobetaine/carnitine-CoA ligase